MPSDEEAKQALMRIEGLLREHINQQAELVRRVERDVGQIRTWTHWCAAAAFVFLGLIVYHYFFK